MVKGLRGAAIVVATVALAMALASCGNSKNASSPTLPPKGDKNLPKGGNTYGVTSNSIDVGTLETASGALASGFGEIVQGAQAYFDLINSQGGVNGRKIYITANENDGGSTTTDKTEALSLVNSHNVFAVVAVGTPFFTGSTVLEQAGMPTFGYVVTQDWNNSPGLFGAYGSYLDYTTEEPTAGYVAAALHAKSVGVIAYNGVSESQAPCAAIADGVTRFGFHLGFKDLNFGLGGSPVADVVKMKQAGVDLIFSCMEGTDNLAFSQELHQYGMKTNFVWLNGYSQSVIKANGSLMNGVIFGEQHVPFEAATQFPGKYPGLELYLKTMKKYYPQYQYDDTAMQGWICATEFVEGLRAIGRNVTQQRLITAINEETADNAGGLEPPINWRTSHNSAAPPYCGSYVEDENGKTKVIFTQGSSVYVCLGANSDARIPNPPGTPGG